jgi:photosystem II protein
LPFEIVVAVAMAAATQVFAAAAAAPAVAVGSALPKSSFSGNSVAQGLPVLSTRAARPLKIVASSGKKTVTKTPLGPSGDTKYRNGVDASGSKAKGKGVYQFSKKYGANVDGYSPIYVEEEWSKGGSVYAGGQAGLALWAVTFAGLLAAGAFLVYSTSALS